MKRELKRGGSKPLVNLYINIPALNVYISGSLNIVCFLQNLSELARYPALATILIANF